ncbi:unnamed protein product [Diamesa serratosioi]
MKLLIVLLVACFCSVNAQNLNPCFGVIDGTFFSHPRTPSKFLACYNGMLEEGSCPPGMEFDRFELHCDFSQNPTTTRRPNDGNMCAGHPDETYLPHPNSNRKFIFCFGGEAVEGKCPDETPIFHIGDLICDTEEEITIRPTLLPTRSPPNRPTQSPTRPSPIRTTQSPTRPSPIRTTQSPTRPSPIRTTQSPTRPPQLPPSMPSPTRQPRP